MADNSMIFSGSSRFASDFQSIINRSVAIASLPNAQLNNVKNTLSSESSALSALDNTFSGLASAIQSLESSMGASSYTSAVSNGAVARATVAEGAWAGTYRIEVTSVGSAAGAMSKDPAEGNVLGKVSDPATQNIASGDTFTLTVGGVAHEFTGITTLNSLAAAINAHTDAGVEATIVNLGTTTDPSYHLALQSDKFDTVAIQLTDSGANPLLDTLEAGSKATYKVNGLSTAISSDTRTITLAPGLTVELLGQSAAGVSTTITVSRNTASVQNALSSFATSYNTAMAELDKHRGANKGALAGDSIVHTLEETLRGIAGYATGADGLSSMTSLGLSFDKTGLLSFNSATFTETTGEDLTALWSFLGGTETGGFLKAATGQLDMISDSTDGILTSTIQSVQNQITEQDKRIAEGEDRVQLLRLSLNQKMAAADALIASLEQQAQYFSGLFAAMQEASRSML